MPTDSHVHGHSHGAPSASAHTHGTHSHGLAPVVQNLVAPSPEAIREIVRDELAKAIKATSNA